MKVRLYNFFNSPWVAFPLMIIVVIVWFVGCEKLADISQRPEYQVMSNGTIKVPDIMKRIKL